MVDVEVAVVGAGPYGLSVAAHLAARRKVVLFGRAMRTWRECMPQDMLLRSDWDNTNLSAAGGQGSLSHWVAETGGVKMEPVPLRSFLEYAAWFRERFVPELDESTIAEVEAADGRFRLRTSAGEEIVAGQVVLALGVTPFSYVPPVLAGVQSDAVSLAVEPRADERLDGKAVVVVGSGQNGLEAALRAKRAGAASVDLLARSQVRWFAEREPSQPRGRLGTRIYRLAYPIVGFGPPPFNRLVLHPDLFARMPESTRGRINARLLRSGGSPWLRKQLEGTVTFHEQAAIRRVDTGPGGLSIEFGAGKRIDADRLIIACGYRFDLDRLTLLSPRLRATVRTVDRGGWPVLDRTLQSTWPGLRFAGYATEGRFGPLGRFVEGTQFAAERIAQAI